MVNEQDPTAADPASGVITPADIQRQEFGVSRFGGYRMRDVDEFLDRLTASTEAIIAENERMRGGGSPIVGTSDLDEVNRQADEIVQRARDEAARIVAEANEHAAALAGGATAVAATGADRAAVDAFLNRERDFLQSLATLVQGHAEAVKAMAKKSRGAPPRGPDDPAAGGAATGAGGGARGDARAGRRHPGARAAPRGPRPRRRAPARGSGRSRGRRGPVAPKAVLGGRELASVGPHDAGRRVTTTSCPSRSTVAVCVGPVDRSAQQLRGQASRRR